MAAFGAILRLPLRLSGSVDRLPRGASTDGVEAAPAPATDDADDEQAEEDTEETNDAEDTDDDADEDDGDDGGEGLGAMFG